MKIAIACDHAGYQTKNKVIQFLKESGYDYTDFGTNSDAPVDYPDFAFKVAEAVSLGKYQRGILICGSGLGMCIAANKVKGIRAVTCNDTFTAEMSRRHNDANVLCLGAKVVKQDKLIPIVKTWLETEFESEGGKSRHQRRLNKISDYEMKNQEIKRKKIQPS
ncbi:MAG: ribose 5-phosphate isomerase B [Planctomycetota bacterium]